MWDRILNSAKAIVGAAVVAATPALIDALDDLQTAVAAAVTVVLGGAVVWLVPNKKLDG